MTASNANQGGFSSMPNNKSSWESFAFYYVNNPDEISGLIKILPESDQRTQQKISSILSKIHDIDYKLLQPFYNQLMQSILGENVHNALTRNVLRIFQFLHHKHFTRDEQGVLINKCFQLVESSKTPIALKVFSITILNNFSKIYPELNKEVEFFLSHMAEYGSAGERSRVHKILEIRKK